MLKKIVVTLVLFACTTICAQPVLNKRLYFGTFPSTIFSNVVATDSCYYVSGKQKNAATSNIQEGLFVKFNLDGSIAHNTAYNNDTAQYIFWESPTLIQTNDNNFALTFAVSPLNGPRHFGFVKMKPNGDTLIFKTYLNLYNDLQDVVFQPGGFLQDSITNCYYGTINTWKESSPLAGVALIKLDSTGNLLWYKMFYGELNDYFGYNSYSLIKTKNHKLIISGTRYKNGLGTASIRSNVKLTITDTTGNLLQTEIYPDDLLATNCHGLTATVDGGYIYAGQNGNFFQNGNAIEYVGRIVKLDSNFNEDWRIERGLPVVEPLINFENVLKISDTNFLAIGTIMDTSSGEIGLSAGWAAQFDLFGNTKWERFYRKVYADNNTINFPRHRLYSADITSDSGFVMVGQAINNETTNPEPFGQLGWLIKTDKHGCLVPGCEQYDGLDIKETDLPEVGLILYPNPASNELYVYYANSGHSNSAEGVLFNIQGKQVMQFSLPTNNTTYMLDVSTLAKGVYIFQVADSSGLLKTEKVVVE